jgi:Lecithin:cholesterol acyltransferase
MRKKRLRLHVIVPLRKQCAWLALLCVFASMMSGCFDGAASVPDLERLFASARSSKGKRPIIFVPGLLGSRLVNERTGEVVWPAFFRSDDDELDLPVGPAFLTSRDSLIATGAIDKARIFKLWPKVNVFHELFNALRQYGGYQEGDWDQPPTNGDRDTFYAFTYDWRRDQVESAQLLIHRIRQLKLKLNRPDLRFNIITVSGGGTIARYAAMYGDADLPAGDVPPEPTWAGAAHINKIFMFGPPNEGTADMLSVLIKGYSFSTGLHRRIKITSKLSREDALTSPAIFELLPHAGTVTFYDQDMKPLAIDIYDPAVWHKYGWTIACEADYRKRFVQRSTRQTALTDASAEILTQRALAQLDGYLAAVLQRTRKYHEALNAFSKVKPPVGYYVFAGDCEETLQNFVIVHDKKRERYETLTRPQEIKGTNGRRFTREEVKRLMFGPGDGRVTRRSLLAETFAEARPADSPYKTTLPIAHSFLICLVHGYIQDSSNVHDDVLTFLVNDAVR